MRRSASLDELPPPPPETLRQRAVYWQYRSVWELAARVPDRLARRLPSRVGRVWHAAASSGQRRQVRRNLARVVPDAGAGELTDLVRAAYVSYARYWLDSFRLHTMDGADVVASSTGEGLEYVDAFRDSGKGGILATCHLGSWDAGAFFTSQRSWGMVAVAEVVEPRRLFERFVHLRRQAGIDVIPLLRGGDMLDRLEARVREDGALATLLADRDLPRRGPIVSFFGEPCRLPPGAAALARRTGRPVCAGAFLTRDDGFHGLVRPPIEIADGSLWDGTQAVAHELEAIIRRAPEQWHVFVPNWLADREPGHPVVAAWRAGEDWRALARDDWERRRRRQELLAARRAEAAGGTDPAPATEHEPASTAPIGEQGGPSTGGHEAITGKSGGLRVGQDEAAPTGDDDGVRVGQDEAAVRVGQDEAAVRVGQDEAAPTGDDDGVSAGEDEAAPTGDDDGVSAGEDEAARRGDVGSVSAGEDGDPERGE